MAKKIGLSKWQREVWDNPARYKVINCGRRAGKSFLCSIKLLKQATEKPRQECWYISPTFRQSKQIMWKMLQELIPKEVVEKTNETELYFRLKNGSSIYLKGASEPDSLRGVKIDLAIFDEVAFFDHWEEVYMIMRPTLMDSQADMWMISTPNGFNHFHSLYNNQIPNTNRMMFPEKDFASYHFTTYDNPYIPREEIENTKYTMTEDRFQQEMMAEFRKMEGLIYKDFSRETHVMKRSMEDFKPVFYLIGLDRGYNNPTAAPLIAVNREDDWHQIRELYKTKLTTPMLDVELKDLRRGIKEIEMMTMDSAQIGDIWELNDMGWYFVPVRKQSGEGTENYVRWKIQKFSERLKVRKGKTPKYTVDPSCINTIKEFENYHYKPKMREDDSEQERPDKKNDHMMDAIGDLNSTYLHLYRDIETNPYDGKLPGTYIPPTKDYAEERDQDKDFISNKWNFS